MRLFILSLLNFQQRTDCIRNQFQDHNSKPSEAFPFLPDLADED